MMERTAFPFHGGSLGNHKSVAAVGGFHAAEQKIKFMGVFVFVKHQPAVVAACFTENMKFGILEIPVHRFHPEGNGSLFRIENRSRILNQRGVRSAGRNLRADFGGIPFHARMQQHGQRLHGDGHGMFSFDFSRRHIRPEVQIERRMENGFYFRRAQYNRQQQGSGNSKFILHNALSSKHLLFIQTVAVRRIILHIMIQIRSMIAD